MPAVNWLKETIAPILALIVVGGGGYVLVTTEQADVRTAVVGLMTLVLGYYFGTSSSSHSKDTMLVNKLTEQSGWVGESRPPTGRDLDVGSGTG